MAITRAGLGGWMALMLALVAPAAPGRQAVPAAAATVSVVADEQLDPQRYISIDEIHRGMRGYGLTVFHGTEPERFELEVVSVMRNYAPKRNAILIKCDDPRFTVAKMVAGCSGSPVFLDGRLAGAMAFGWVMSEEPLYGVTPIGEMLEVRKRANLDAVPTGGQAKLARGMYENLMRDVLVEPADVREYCGRLFSATEPGQSPVVLCTSGMSAGAARHLEEMVGISVVQAAGGGGDAVAADLGKPLRPGSAVTVPLLLGEVQAQVLGTVTEVIGPEVFAFGHGWNSEGPTLWPMATGFVHTFVSRKDRSFKLGHVGQIVGSLRADEATAVYGRTDLQAMLAPVTVEVQWPDQTERFDLQMVKDNQLAPVMAVTALLNALDQRGGLPRYHSLEYQVSLEFDGVEPIRFSDVSAGSSGSELGNDVLTTLMILLGNPWERLEVTAVDVQVRVIAEDLTAPLRSLAVEQRLYHPGDTIRGQVEFEPLWAPTARIPFELQLREDLPEGAYQLHIDTRESYRQLLRRHQPQRELVFSAADVRKVLQQRMDLRRDRLYVTLVLPGDGLAVESQAMPQLPASRTMLLTDAARAVPTARFQPLQTRTFDTPYRIMGDHTLEIKVSRNQEPQ